MFEKKEMMHNKDKVSIVIPVHNARSFIEKTTESVKSQTYDNWELILVENASVDGTKEVIERLAEEDERIRVIDLKDSASAALARNAGVEASNGRFVSFLDADDIWREDKLEKECAFMIENDAAFAFTGYEFGDDEANPTGKIVKVPKVITYKEALKNTTIFTSTVMFDTSKIQRQSIRMPEIKSEDTALWWKLLREGFDAYGLNENLVIYRRPARSLSSNKFEAIKRIWYLYRKWEKLSLIKSAWYFVNWAINAVLRRV